MSRGKAPRILVADDLPDVRAALRLLLKGADYAVVEAASVAEAEAALGDERIDLALVDMNYARDTTSGGEGLDLVARLHAREPHLPIVVMTAWGSVGVAVEAMRRGARDFVEKPWQNDRLLATIRRELDLRDALALTDRLVAHSAREHARASPDLIFGSKAMDAVERLIERVARSDAGVLITGEHGTGKDVVARRIHAASGRASKAFVPVNAGALADGVFESELFGHVRGAFTDAKADRIGCFELADGGTLFLDEIGTMPLGQQAKLLRALQSGEIQPVGASRLRHADVRVVAATNVDVPAEVARGSFRQDLLYRLNTVTIQLPPLRERPEDIPILARHFLARKAARYGKADASFTSEALSALAAHHWPGNVRELEHAVERALVLAEGPQVGVSDVDLPRAERGAGNIEAMTIAEAEVHLIRRAMERTGGNVVAAAEALGLSRSALYRRLSSLGIKVSE